MNKQIHKLKNKEKLKRKRLIDPKVQERYGQMYLKAIYGLDIKGSFTIKNPNGDTIYNSNDNIH